MKNFYVLLLSLSGFISNAQYYPDNDADTFGDPLGVTVAVPTPGYVLDNTDCNDSDSTMHESFIFFLDEDGDGFGSNTPIYLCAIDAYSPPFGYVLDNTDCNDYDPTIHESFYFFADFDGDGFGSSILSYVCAINATTPPMGFVLYDTSDCNDFNPTITMGSIYYTDYDGDGFGGGPMYIFCDFPGPGFATINGDCNDADPTVQNATSVYIDNDGDGYGSGVATLTCLSFGVGVPIGFSINDFDCDDTNPLATIGTYFYVDADNDGYGSSVQLLICGVFTSPPIGYSLNSSDCDDNDSTVFQYASSVGIDADADGYITGFTSICYGIALPVGYIFVIETPQYDCDDNNSSTFNSAILFMDTDGDGYNNGNLTLCYNSTLPTVPIGYSYTTLGEDCNDNNINVTNECYALNSNCGNTFVKEIDGFGSGIIKPNIFKHPNGDFYTSNTFGNTIKITRHNPNGIVLWSKAIDFGDNVSSMFLQDLAIDPISNTIAGVVGTGYTDAIPWLSNSGYSSYVFKFNETTQSIIWSQLFTDSRFWNIHKTNATQFVVTSQDTNYLISATVLDSSTGSIISRKTGTSGEFYSTYYSGSLYGSCRYYHDSNSQFFTSIFKWDSTSLNNVWTKTYIKNAPVTRIYPVDPIVDSGSIVQLSFGNDTNFDDLYYNDSKIWLLKTDLNGSLNWTKQIDIPGYTKLEAIQVINSNTGYYLLINSNTGTYRDFFFVVKTDKLGNILWSKRFGTSGLNYVTSGIENNDYLYLTGITESLSGIKKMFLTKLNPLGETENTCTFINSITSTSTGYLNSEVTRPPVSNIVFTSSAIKTGIVNAIVETEIIYCSTPCELLSNINLESRNNLVYPNPTYSMLNVVSKSLILSTEISDINGRIIQVSLQNSNEVVLNIENFQSGIYLLKVTTEKGTSTEKIVKK